MTARCPACGAELRAPTRLVRTITALLLFAVAVGFVGGIVAR